jgi:hypothetical protein
VICEACRARAADERRQADLEQAALVRDLVAVDRAVRRRQKLRTGEIEINWTDLAPAAVRPLLGEAA